jgi:sugar phosphate isomerase/epimerase
MNLSTHGLQRDVLNSILRFAKGIGAEVMICHAGQRVAARDARHSMEDQHSAERSALREAGDLAGELGVTMAVENFYPERPILRGAIYDYSVWPSQLADFIEECAAVASLVRHVNLHNNLQRTNVTGEPQASEHTVYGMVPLPPGRGTIPLEDLFRRMEFPESPSCCVELSPNSSPWYRRLFTPPERSAWW